MPEYEKVRIEAIKRTMNILNLPPDVYSITQCAHRIVAHILSADGIEIRADDQGLPTNEDIPVEFNELACGAEDESDNVARACYLLAQQDMLKPDSEGRKFIKVISREGQ